MSAPSGWYPTAQGQLRYWDGTAWTAHTAPVPTPRTARESRTPLGLVGRLGAPGWLGWAGLGLLAGLGAASGGVSGLFVLTGFYVLGVAVVALVRGRVAWAGLRSRATAGGAFGLALALTTVGGATATPAPSAAPNSAPSAPAAPGIPDSSPSNVPAATPTHTPVVAPTATPTPPPPKPSATTSAVPPSSAAKGAALAAVAGLTVKGRSPKTGYSRDAFGQAWFDTDRNGCDTRNDVLRRDLVERQMKNWCKVLAGTRAPDPYTGSTIRFVIGGASEIDIDHVVALSDAWQKGASAWSAGKRLAFANDPLVLLAVDARANRSKGDGDTATWLPPNKSFRCQYVARQVAIKLKYQLWVTSAERDAIVRVLSACPTTTLPPPGSAPTVAALPKSTPKATTGTKTTTVPLPAVPSSVHYANCAAVRAAGAAPLLAGQPGYARKLDRDGDGIACE